MSATCEDALLLDRKQAVWTDDGFHVWGSPREGWHVCERVTGQEVAHLTEPGLDSLGALDRYRKERDDLSNLQMARPKSEPARRKTTRSTDSNGTHNHDQRRRDDGDVAIGE